MPISSNYHKEKADLGKKLFDDPILSENGTIACVTCHYLDLGGVDNRKLSVGIYGQKSDYNTPTVFNTIYNFRHTWNGTDPDLETRILNVIENTKEMGFSIDLVIKKLQKKDEYVHEFNKLYMKGLDKESLLDVLSQFMKALTTPHAPFDKYLRGDKTAISHEAKKGFELFRSKGCIACHQGVNIGGNMYNKFGVFREINSTSLGRYHITGKEEDKKVFRVPSLRNVALTAPYMHDGSIKTLQEAVEIMSHYQLGRHMEEGEIDSIVAFLESLTGEKPEILH